MKTYWNNAIKALSLFFMPQRENKFAPAAMSGKAMVFYVLVALLIKSLSLVSGLTIPGTQLFADVSSQFVIALTNQERQTQGLQPLAENKILDKAACAKVNDMIQNRYFAHDSPQGVDPWHWFKQAGYQYQNAGENLAIDFYQSSDVVNAWMNSPSHRANMLGNYQDIGLCVAQGNVQGYDSTIVAQLFGTPRSPAPVRHVQPRQIQVSVPSPSRQPIAVVSPKSSVEGLHTSMPTPSSTKSFLVGSADTNTTGLGMSLLKEKPMLFGKAWDTIVNPFWLYAGMLAYLVSLIVIGAFARAYTPSPRALIGMVAVIFIVMGMMSLPSGADLLHGSARVLMPTMIQAK